MTVSHVINQTRFVSEDVKERVHMAMPEFNYQPNALPRSLRSGKTHTLSGWKAAHKLLNQAHQPTAIFACNDLLAMGVLRATVECGIRVPEDLALVGYDDIELAANTTPRLPPSRRPKARWPSLP